MDASPVQRRVSLPSLLATASRTKKQPLRRKPAHLKWEYRNDLRIRSRDTRQSARANTFFEAAEMWPADILIFVERCACLKKTDRIPLVQQSTELTRALAELLFF
jgi:hypothetical protein